MVQVKSSRGGTVSVEIKGVSETIANIIKLGQNVNQGADVGTFLAANYLQNEVQESIIGNRAEPRSVKTGNFANSINLTKLKDKEFQVSTDVEYSKHLEYGTSKMAPRSHFRNSLARSKQKMKEIVQSEISRVVK